MATETEIKYLDLPDTTFKNFNNNRGDRSEIDKVFTKNRQNLSRDREIIDNVNINAENRGSKRYGHEYCFFSFCIDDNYGSRLCPAVSLEISEGGLKSSRFT